MPILILGIVALGAYFMLHKATSNVVNPPTSMGILAKRDYVLFVYAPHGGVNPIDVQTEVWQVGQENKWWTTGNAQLMGTGPDPINPAALADSWGVQITAMADVPALQIQNAFKAGVYQGLQNNVPGQGVT